MLTYICVYFSLGRITQIYTHPGWGTDTSIHSTKVQCGEPMSLELFTRVEGGVIYRSTDDSKATVSPKTHPNMGNDSLKLQPGAVSTTCRHLDRSESPFSAVVPFCYSGCQDPCLSPFPGLWGLLTSWIFPPASKRRHLGRRKLLHNNILWPCLCVLSFCPTQLQPLVLCIHQLELTKLNNHSLADKKQKFHSLQLWRLEV